MKWINQFQRNFIWKNLKGQTKNQNVFGHFIAVTCPYLCYALGYSVHLKNTVPKFPDK